MSLIDRAFDIRNGLSLSNTVGIFFSDTDPTTGGGADAPVGSLILYTPASGEPKLYKKYDTGTIDWKYFQTVTFVALTNPTVNHDDSDTAGVGRTFEPGDFWVNTTTSTGLYTCFSNSTGSAVWNQVLFEIPFETSTGNIKEDGTASVGILDTVPRADHVHPSMFTTVYATVSEAEAAPSSDNKMCYVVETETWYRYESSGSAYTDDNKYVLSTGDGGTTRWLGFSGNYQLKQFSIYGTFAGTYAGHNVTGIYNTAYGFEALKTNTDGANNVAIGVSSLKNSNSNNVIAIGEQAGAYCDEASNSIFIGQQAGEYAVGDYNVYVGYYSGYGSVSTTTASSYNIGLGYNSLRGLTSGDNNFTAGKQSGENITEGSNNILLGQLSGNTLTTQTNVIALGYQSLFSNTTASNISMGAYAGNSNVTGEFVLYIGHEAGRYNTGKWNSAVGYNSLKGSNGVSTGYANSVYGVYAGTSITNGYENTMGGAYSGYALTSGDRNIFLGYASGVSLQTANNNIAIGYYALAGLNSKYPGSCIAIGWMAGTNVGNINSAILLGYECGRVSSGVFNNFIGFRSGYYSWGSYNTIYGNESLYGVNGQTTASYNTLTGYRNMRYATTAYQNSIYGYLAGYSIIGGDYNTIAGSFSGYHTEDGLSNSFYGRQSGYANRDGDYNTFVGDSSGQYYSSNNNTALGYEALRGAIAYKEITQITVNSATKANYVGDYFTLYLPDSTQYDFWFDTTGSDSVPAGATSNPTKIDISSQSTINGIATYIAIYVNSIDGFNSSSETSPAIITCEDFGATTDPVGTNASEISISVTQQGTDISATGSYNVAAGFSSLKNISSGNFNLVLGGRAGGTITVGSSNIILGYSSDINSNSDSDCVIIGANIQATASAQIRIGNGSATSCFIQGIYGQTDGSNPYVRIDSDGRLYQDNNPPSAGSGSVNQIAIFTSTGSITGVDQNTAFNKDFETSTGNIQAAGSVSVGILSTIARADHIHPLPTITEDNISLSDVTTNNATTGRHGFLPKLSGDSSEVLRGDGTFAAVSSSTGVSAYLDEFTSSTGQTKFALSVSPINDSAVTVSVDGVIQNSDVYSFFSSTGIVAGVEFLVPLSGGEEVRFYTLTNNLTLGGADLTSERITVTSTGETSFTMSRTPISKNLMFVTVDGIFQHSTAYDYSGTTLTFTEGLTSGNEIQIIYIMNFNAAVPADNSVTRSKLSNIDLYKFSPTVSQDLTLIENDLSVGSVTIASGVTVTVSSGYEWVIV